MPRREDYRIGMRVRVLDISPRTLMQEYGGQIGVVTHIDSGRVHADVPSLLNGMNRGLVFDFNFLEIVTGDAPPIVHVLCSAQIDHENAIVGVFASLSQIYAWVSNATWLGVPLLVDRDAIFVARQTELLDAESERPVLRIRTIPINTMLDNTCVSMNLRLQAASPLSALADFDSADFEDEYEDDDEE